MENSTTIAVDLSKTSGMRTVKSRQNRRTDRFRQVYEAVDPCELRREERGWEIRHRFTPTPADSRQAADQYCGPHGDPRSSSFHDPPGSERPELSDRRACACPLQRCSPGQGDGSSS